MRNIHSHHDNGDGTPACPSAEIQRTFEPPVNGEENLIFLLMNRKLINHIAMTNQSGQSIKLLCCLPDLSPNFHPPNALEKTNLNGVTCSLFPSRICNSFIQLKTNKTRLFSSSSARLSPLSGLAKSSSCSAACKEESQDVATRISWWRQSTAARPIGDSPVTSSACERRRYPTMKVPLSKKQESISAQRQAPHAVDWFLKEIT